MNNTIAAIILTKNESKHITRCIESVKDVCDEIFVVDSFSTDDTCDLARTAGAVVVQNAWTNHATQFNFGVYQLPIKSEWIWRVDADEYLEGGLGLAVKAKLSVIGSTVNGVYVRKRIDFMGKPLLHGGWYPCYNLKIIRRGHGDCENRWMDEHLRIFDGTTVTVDDGNQVDDNKNNLTWWTEKHNGYATREMVDMLLTKYQMDDKSKEVEPHFFGTEEQRKRWLKLRYIKAPLFVRPFFNFMLRYVFEGGFLDGKEGFVWHILQGFWYRMLVDAKTFEIYKRFNYDDEKIKEYLKNTYLK